MAVKTKKAVSDDTASIKIIKNYQATFSMLILLVLNLR